MKFGAPPYHMAMFLVRIIRSVLGSDIRFGVEVGVHRGKTSSVLLAAFPDMKLVLIDPYKPHEEMRLTQAEQDDYKEEMKQRIEVFGDRAYFIESTSKDAYLQFCPDMFDFAFIDGHHTKEAVLENLHEWYGRVKVGGAVICHDWTSKPGVRKALKAFAEEAGVRITSPHSQFAYIIKRPKTHRCDLRTTTLENPR